MLRSLELKWERLRILLIRGTLVSHHKFPADVKDVNLQPRDAAHCIRLEKEFQLKTIIELSLLDLRLNKYFPKWSKLFNGWLLPAGHFRGRWMEIHPTSFRWASCSEHLSADRENMFHSVWEVWDVHRSK